MTAPSHAPRDPVQKPGTRRWSWRRRLGCGCLSLIVSSVLGLIVLEWILRANVGHFLGAPGEAMFMYEPDGGRSYRLKPGWEGRQTVEGRTTPVRINARGMRGADTGAKTPGETRIAMFGDSFVFGHGVTESESIPAQAQRSLRETWSEGTVTVGNCGISGQGLRDMVLNVKRQLDWQPDVFVLVCYLGNDFTDDCREYTTMIEGFLLFGGMARAAVESTRFRLTLRYRSAYILEQFLTRYAPSMAFDRSQLGPTAAERAALEHFPPEAQRFACLFLDRQEDDALVAKVLARTRPSLRSMQKLADGRPVLLVLLPSKWHVDRERWGELLKKQNADPAVHEFGRARQRMIQLAEDLNLRHLDLVPALTNVPEPKSLWFEKDSHLSVAGCRVAAQRIAKEVKEILGREP